MYLFVALFLVYYGYHNLAKLDFSSSGYSISSGCIFLCLCTSTFYLFYTNILRQGLAFGFVLLAASFIYKKQSFLALFVSVLAFYTHKSSAVLIVFFAVSSRIEKAHGKIAIYLVLISFVLYLVDFISIISKIPILGEKMRLMSASRGNENLILKVFLNLIVLVLLIFLGEKKGSNYFNKILLANSMILSLAIVTLTAGEFSKRFIMYCSLINPFLIMRSIHFFDKKHFILFTLMTGCIFYSLYVLHHPSIQYTLGID